VSGAVFLITGISAAGKSTVGELLARRFEPGVHVRGDVFRRMVVSDRADMSMHPSEEARRQLELRYRLGAATADAYARAGFTVVVQDVVLGDYLPHYAEMITSRPVHVIVLAPRAEVVAAREAGRAKNAYRRVNIEYLEVAIRDTPRIGMWVDSSDQTPDETVAEILRRAEREGPYVPGLRP